MIDVADELSGGAVEDLSAVFVEEFCFIDFGAVFCDDLNEAIVHGSENSFERLIFTGFPGAERVHHVFIDAGSESFGFDADFFHGLNDIEKWAHDDADRADDA